MKILLVASAVLCLTTALPQRRVSLKPQPQAQPAVEAQHDDQQTAEQNYNNYNNAAQNYRQQEQDYRTQRQDYRETQQDNRQTQQDSRQLQQQEYRQPKPVEDFRPKVTLDTTTFVPIIRFDKEQGTDGSYKTAYETGNHIQAEEQGFLRAVDQDNSALVQQGSYSYTAPDGQVISVEYTADEFGFRVKGDHIPTPPPVSPEIQKGLDLIYAGIKSNQERHEQELRDNPNAAKEQESKAALDYKGFYYPQ